MQILVTGASGFIGSALIPELRRRGHRLCRDFNGADCAIHLANIAHTPASPAELHRVNVAGTVQAGTEAAAAGCRRFVYVSSAKAIDPDDHYGRAKLAAEHGLSRIGGLEVVVLRPPLVYGPGVKANFLKLMRAMDLGLPLPFASIRNRRSLIYLGNLVDAIVRLVEAPVSGRTYALSDGSARSTPDHCRAIAQALGRPARLFPFPPTVLELLPSMKRLTRSLEVDDSMIRLELGWQPPYSFEEGLRATAQWYRDR
jgi:nucleoside-diphosphate-sugar epimerase